MTIKKLFKKISSHPLAINADVVLAEAYATNMREEMFRDR